VLASPLPIELISFNAKVIENEVELDWSTATEMNNDFFTIERSQSGEEWENIIEVKGAGNSTQTLHYNTKDTQPLFGVSYYRLKQTDYDGKYSYSSIKRVELELTYQLKAFPNPNTGIFKITTGFELDRSNIRLRNLHGQSIPINFKLSDGEYLIEPESPTPGIYILQVKKGFWTQSLRVIIE
jgi:Secretion system C-terminal sorting domain